MNFEQRIGEATTTKDKSYKTYEQYYNDSNKAKTNYDTDLKNSKDYGSIYDEARNKYLNSDEVKAAKGTYENSRNAIDQINTTMNKLPESISQQYGGTGLTEAQRSRAMGQQQQQMSNTYNYLNSNYQNATSDYQTLADRAMQETQNVAGGNYQSQQDKLNALQDAWKTLLNQSTSSYSQYQQDNASRNSIYSEQDNYNFNQQQLALERWKEEQANARSAAERNAQLNLQKYLAQQQTNQANAQSALQSQLLDKQNRADYNKYRSQANSSINEQFKKDNSNLFSHLFGGDNYRNDILNKTNKARSGIMSYDQWVGNK